MKPYYIVFIRPVGSRVWTSERIATSRDAAERYAAEERNKKVRFADGSVHLQSTAVVQVELPEPPDSTQQHFEAWELGTCTRSIP